METKRLSRQEVGKRGEELYKRTIRDLVETPANIGKMVIIDVETGTYEVARASAIYSPRRGFVRQANWL